MIVKFIKQGPAGVKKGTIVDTAPANAKRWTSKKGDGPYVEKATQKDLDEYNEKAKAEQIERPKEIAADIKKRAKGIRSKINKKSGPVKDESEEVEDDGPSDEEIAQAEKKDEVKLLTKVLDAAIDEAIKSEEAIKIAKDVCKRYPEDAQFKKAHEDAIAKSTEDAKTAEDAQLALDASKEGLDKPDLITRFLNYFKK